MSDLWKIAKANWKPVTDAEWAALLKEADWLMDKYESDELAFSMMKAYMDVMEKEARKKPS